MEENSTKSRARALIPLIFILMFFLMAALSFVPSQSPTTSPGQPGFSPSYTTDNNVIFNAFGSIAVILILVLAPLLFFLYRREQAEKGR